MFQVPKGMLQTKNVTVIYHTYYDFSFKSQGNATNSKGLTIGSFSRFMFQVPKGMLQTDSEIRVEEELT